jgi:hypothetical protein
LSKGRGLLTSLFTHESNNSTRWKVLLF